MYILQYIIRVSFTMRQASLSAKPDGIVEVYSEEVAFIFDQHKILTIEVCVCVCVCVCVVCVNTRT